MFGILFPKAKLLTAIGYYFLPNLQDIIPFLVEESGVSTSDADASANSQFPRETIVPLAVVEDDDTVKFNSDVIGVIATFLPPTTAAQKPLMLVNEVWYRGVVEQDGMKPKPRVMWPWDALHRRGCRKVRLARNGTDNDFLVLAQQMPEVEQVSVDPLCKGISDHGVAYMVGKLTSIKRLNLNGLQNGITAAAMFYISELRTLESLDVSGRSAISPDGFSYLTLLPELTELNLFKCTKVNDIALKQIANIKTLVSLNIGNCSNIAPDDLKHLSKLEHLTELDLSHSDHLNAFYLREVAKVTTLEILDISRSPRVRNDGLRFVSKITNLRRLDISGTATTDEYLDAGVLSLKSLQHLRSLRFADGEQLLSRLSVFADVAKSIKTLTCIDVEIDGSANLSCWMDRVLLQNLTARDERTFLPSSFIRAWYPQTTNSVSKKTQAIPQKPSASLIRHLTSMLYLQHEHVDAAALAICVLSNSFGVHKDTNIANAFFGCVPQLVDLLASTCPRLLICALRSLRNIFRWSPCPCVLSCRDLDSLHHLLDHPRREVRREVLTTLARLIRHPNVRDTILRMALEENMHVLRRIQHYVSFAIEDDISAAACHVVCSATHFRSASDRMFTLLSSYKAFQHACNAIRLGHIAGSHGGWDTIRPHDVVSFSLATISNYVASGRWVDVLLDPLVDFGSLSRKLISNVEALSQHSEPAIHNVAEPLLYDVEERLPHPDHASLFY